MNVALLSSGAAFWVAWVAQAALVVVRLTPATLMLPYFGGRNLPNQARIPLLLALAVGTMPSLIAFAPVRPVTAFYVLAIAREIAIGTTFALVLAVPLFALEHGGHLLDAARGANVAEVIAPDSGARSSPLAELLRWTFAVVFLGAGGLRAIVRVFAVSLETWPPTLDPRSMPALGALTDAAARWTAVSLGASLVLVSAGLLALVAAEIALGIASRVSPPLAQSQLALPIRALAPLALLALTVGVWTGAARDLARLTIDAAQTLGQ